MRLLGIIVLIVILALLSYWYKQSHKEIVFPKEMAAKGQVVSGFPKELLFDPITTTQSYKISYSSSKNQYVAEYNSKDSHGLVFVKTVSYLKGNNFYISAQQLQPKQANAYGIGPNDKIEISLVVTPNGDKKNTSHVIISYLNK